MCGCGRTWRRSSPIRAHNPQSVRTPKLCPGPPPVSAYHGNLPFTRDRVPSRSVRGDTARGEGLGPFPSLFYSKRELRSRRRLASLLSDLPKAIPGAFVAALRCGFFPAYSPDCDRVLRERERNLVRKGDQGTEVSMATATVAGTVGVKSVGPTSKLSSAFRGAGFKLAACRGSQASPVIGLRVVATATDTASERLTPGVGNNLDGLVSDTKTIRPVIVIDNYDSFTYNLCQYLGDLKCLFEVYRNDELSVDEIARRNPRGILISPGPGAPQDSGISLETVLKLGPTIPLFGVCMGLQCMGEAFGGNVVRAPNGVMHGKTSLVYHNDSADGLMTGLPNPFVACRYHSLVIDKATFPSDELEITAWTADDLVMGVRHKKYRHIEGVQFHPESIITENGMKIVENFVKGLDRFAALKGEAAAQL